MDSAFSPETFLTNLAAMSAPARNALFANSGMPGLRRRIETMDRKALLRRDGAQVFLIEARISNQTAHIETFNGRFRDECLYQPCFTSLAHARVIVDAWRREYNKERPKRSLGGLTPPAYAQRLMYKH